MTLVGKILVVIITILSLVFMSMAVAVFATQTNWKAETAKRDQRVKDKQKEVDRLRADFSGLAKTYTDELTAHGADNKKAQDELKEAMSAYQQLRDRYDETKKQAAEDTTRAKLAMDEVATRRKEAAELADQLKKAINEKELIGKKAFETDQKLIELQTQIAVAEERNKSLQQRSSELIAILTEKGLPTSLEDKTIIENPPDVEGVIKKVDAVSRLVEISIGSDDGLRAGHKLDVYRVKPSGQYLGRVEVRSVDPDQAVCRIIPELKRATIQEGDLVSTRITARR